MAECAVGRLKARYRSLSDNSSSVINLAIIVPVCCVLHNVYETKSIIYASMLYFQIVRHLLIIINCQAIDFHKQA